MGCFPNRKDAVILLRLLFILGFFHNCKAYICEVGREKDDTSVWRWVLPYDDPCGCSKIIMGGMNTWTPIRPFKPIYVDNPLISDDIGKIRTHYGLDCDATCFPVCPHYGTCEAPDTCSCTQCYEGARCESVLSGIAAPLGLQNGSIEDSQMTASSEYSADLAAHKGRLHNVPFWASKHVVTGQWLQVDFLKLVVITGIKTQGASSIAQWAKSVKVKYGEKIDALQTILENGSPKSFTANVYKNAVKQIDFPGHYVARYLRVIVVTYNSHPAMRMEVLGYNCG